MKCTLFCLFLIDSSLVKWCTKEYRNDSWVAVISPNKNYLGQKVGFQYIAIIVKYAINKHIAGFQFADIYTFYTFFKPQEIWLEQGVFCYPFSLCHFSASLSYSRIAICYEKNSYFYNSFNGLGGTGLLFLQGSGIATNR